MLLAFDVAAATISLSGIVEGAQMVLAPSATTTNLTVAATPSLGTPPVKLTLERSGVVVVNATATPPYSVIFSNLIAGKYFLSANIEGDAASATDVSFDIRATSLQPPNDLWSQASPIAANGTVALGTNTFASSEPNEPVHADNSGGRSLWWKWTATSNGPITFTTLGSTFDTVLAVYTGTNVGQLKVIAANDDAGSTNRFSQVTFAATGGTTYSIASDGAQLSNGQAASGVISLTALASAPPSVSISFPTNGFYLRVPSTLPTKLNAVAVIADPAGLQRVEYALDGADILLAGTLAPPYQWSLPNLPPGDFLLTVCAVDNLGLISSAHASFSIVSTAPRILLVDTSPFTPTGFQFAVSGLKGTSYQLQSAANVPVWDSLVLWTNFDGVQRVLDTNSPQFSARFYRVITP